MIPYGRQSITTADSAAVLKTLHSPWLTQGPAVSAFEQALAAYCGTRYAVAVSNGTAALHLAYGAAGLTAGDEVITTPNTFVATTNMLLAVGAKPVFCDIRSDTYNIDETKIERLITKKTKAIVPVHFAGQPCALDPIRRIARKHRLLVIEDACHSLGARYQKSTIGSCRFSDMAIFSFHPVKSITTGEGGAILTNSKRYYQTVLSLRSHGIHKDARGKNVMTALGYNYRLTDIQAALGASQLKKLDAFIKQRQRVVAWYAKELQAVTEIILPQEIAGDHSAWHLYVIRTQQPKRRDALAAYLKKQGIGVNFHYPAVYSHPYYRKNGYHQLRLPVADAYQSSCLTLPCHPALTRDDVHFVADAIKTFYAKK